MPFVPVLTYSLGYITAQKQFFLDYTLEGDNSVQQIFITAEESVALSDMFRHYSPISFNTDVSYFTSSFRTSNDPAVGG
jgi:hypothetical protein